MQLTDFERVTKIFVFVHMALKLHLTLQMDNYLCYVSRHMPELVNYCMCELES